MIPPPTSRVRVRTLSEAESGGGARSRTIARGVCDGSFVASARIIKNDERSTVFSAEIAGYPVVVKTLALDRVKDRLRARFGRTRLSRQARGAARLESCGVHAIQPYAIVRGLTGEGEPVEALVMPRAEGPTLLRAALDRTINPHTARELLDQIGADIAGMVRAGLYNRDHKPSNIILHTDERGAIQPVLIDTADIRRCLAKGGTRMMARMLAKLRIETIGTSVPVSIAEQVRVARSAQRSSNRSGSLRELLIEVQGIIDAHGDPKPRHDPLAFDDA